MRLLYPQAWALIISVYLKALARRAVREAYTLLKGGPIIEGDKEDIVFALENFT